MTVVTVATEERQLPEFHVLVEPAHGIGDVAAFEGEGYVDTQVAVKLK